MNLRYLEISWKERFASCTYRSRIVSFQLANLFKLDIYMTFVNSSWKKWTDRIISLIILIGYMTFLSLFLDVIRMSWLTVSFLVHLDSGILRSWRILSFDLWSAWLIPIPLHHPIKDKMIIYYKDPKFAGNIRPF